MKNFRKAILVGAVVFSMLAANSSAYAGLLVSDFTGGGQPVKCERTEAKGNWSVVVTGFVSVLVTGFTSVLVTGLSSGERECAVIIHD